MRKGRTDTGKGLAGCRKSKDTPHRRRCLRTNKKRMRQEDKNEIMELL